MLTSRPRPTFPGLARSDSITMSDTNDISRMKEELAKDNRDVADLWNDDLRKYKGTVGVDLQPKDDLFSVHSMVQFGTEQMTIFTSFATTRRRSTSSAGSSATTSSI